MKKPWMVLGAFLLLLYSCSDPRHKFLGVFACHETCAQLGEFKYDIFIHVGSGTDDLVIENFGGIDVEISAYVSDAGFDIPAQTVLNGSGDSLTVSGSGSKDGDDIRISYTLETGAGSTSCEVISD